MSAPTASSRLTVKVVPGSKQNAIAGRLGDALKVKIQAPPVDGRANAALCEFMADTFGVPRSAVSVASGASNSRKHLVIAGLDQAAINRRLDELL